MPELIKVDKVAAVQNLENELFREIYTCPSDSR
jgi:hypothetical protein